MIWMKIQEEEMSRFMPRLWLKTIYLDLCHFFPFQLTPQITVPPNPILDMHIFWKECPLPPTGVGHGQVT